MFITASWFPELKNYLGLRGVSPVWRDKPAYYFWIDGSPCVFSLELGHAESEMGLVEEFIYCDFLVRAFPFRNTDLYSGFSEHEKRALSGPIFDGSNTPCFERLEDLNKNFFIVSRIDWLYGKSGSWGLFSLNALDLHVTRRDDCRAVLRKVPSWQISLPLFDILNSLYALYSKQKPRRARLVSKSGLEYVVTSVGEIKSVENAAIKNLELTSLFIDENGSGEIEALGLFETKLAGCPEEIVFDLTFQPTDGPDKGLILPGSEKEIGRKWWTIDATNFNSSMICPCGCNHD
ncbi:MAG: hypothetical protein P4L38_00460 [Syntrophaceae bacterium]|nr:hypothetical protein [Syntrophaceae bacterium]